MILEAILAGATLGGIIGEAVATIAGLDVVVATATGTIAGAAGGAVIGISETASVVASC